MVLIVGMMIRQCDRARENISKKKCGIEMQDFGRRSHNRCNSFKYSGALYIYIYGIFLKKYFLSMF